MGSYFKLTTQLREVVHHASHQVDIDHENRCVTLFEEVIDTLEALLELLTLCLTHHVGQLSHSLGGLDLVGREFDVLDEKLQRRFLQNNWGVRSLRLS